MQWKTVVCVLLVGCILVGLLGWFIHQRTEQPKPNETPTATPTLTPSPTATPSPTPTPTPTATPTPTPSPEPTPTPTPTPVPTRAPMEGDVATVNFPDYDTGEDADYSYQSDELRIAVFKHQDSEIKQTYYVADIWMRNISCFRTGFGRGKFNTGREDGEKFAQREHAILAVNGSMNYGLTIHNREKIKTGTRNGYEGIFVLYEDGSMKAFDTRKDRFNLRAEEEKGIVHAWNFGPTLLQNGEFARKFPNYGTRHPRIIVGYYEPGHYVCVAVDGRNKKSAIGMNTYEEAELMQNLGCKEAMNFDGGTSAIMVFMGECISHPSGVDTDGDGKAGRNIADMLLFAEYDADGNAPALSEIDTARLRGYEN